jgi:hypothetical protein
MAKGLKNNLTLSLWSARDLVPGTNILKSKRHQIVTKSKNLSEVPAMNDEEMADFWEKHEPEDFNDWEEGGLDFKARFSTWHQISPVDFPDE